MSRFSRSKNTASPPRTRQDPPPASGAATIASSSSSSVSPNRLSCRLTGRRTKLGRSASTASTCTPTTSWSTTTTTSAGLNGHTSASTQEGLGNMPASSSTVRFEDHRNDVGDNDKIDKLVNGDTVSAHEEDNDDSGGLNASSMDDDDTDNQTRHTIETASTIAKEVREQERARQHYLGTIQRKIAARRRAKRLRERSVQRKFDQQRRKLREEAGTDGDEEGSSSCPLEESFPAQPQHKQESAVPLPEESSNGGTSGAADCELTPNRRNRLRRFKRSAFPAKEGATATPPAASGFVANQIRRLEAKSPTSPSKTNNPETAATPTRTETVAATKLAPKRISFSSYPDPEPLLMLDDELESNPATRSSTPIELNPDLSLRERLRLINQQQTAPPSERKNASGVDKENESLISLSVQGYNEFHKRMDASRMANSCTEGKEVYQNDIGRGVDPLPTGNDSKETKQQHFDEEQPMLKIETRRAMDPPGAGGADEGEEEMPRHQLGLAGGRIKPTHSEQKTGIHRKKPARTSPSASLKQRNGASAREPRTSRCGGALVSEEREASSQRACRPSGIVPPTRRSASEARKISALTGSSLAPASASHRTPLLAYNSNMAQRRAVQLEKGKSSACRDAPGATSPPSRVLQSLPSPIQSISTASLPSSKTDETPDGPPKEGAQPFNPKFLRAATLARENSPETKPRQQKTATACKTTPESGIEDIALRTSVTGKPSEGGGRNAQFSMIPEHAKYLGMPSLCSRSTGSASSVSTGLDDFVPEAGAESVEELIEYSKPQNGEVLNRTDDAIVLEHPPSSLDGKEDPLSKLPSASVLDPYESILDTTQEESVAEEKNKPLTEEMEELNDKGADGHDQRATIESAIEETLHDKKEDTHVPAASGVEEIESNHSNEEEEPVATSPADTENAKVLENEFCHDEFGSFEDDIDSYDGDTMTTVSSLTNPTCFSHNAGSGSANGASSSKKSLVRVGSNRSLNKNDMWMPTRNSPSPSVPIPPKPSSKHPIFLPGHGDPKREGDDTVDFRGQSFPPRDSSRKEAITLNGNHPATPSVKSYGPNSKILENVRIWDNGYPEGIDNDVTPLRGSSREQLQWRQEEHENSPLFTKSMDGTPPPIPTSPVEDDQEDNDKSRDGLPDVFMGDTSMSQGIGVEVKICDSGSIVKEYFKAHAEPPRREDDSNDGQQSGTMRARPWAQFLREDGKTQGDNLDPYDMTRTISPIQPFVLPHASSRDCVDDEDEENEENEETDAFDPFSTSALEEDYATFNNFDLGMHNQGGKVWNEDNTQRLQPHGRPFYSVAREKKTNHRYSHIGGFPGVMKAQRRKTPPMWAAYSMESVHSMDGEKVANNHLAHWGDDTQQSSLFRVSTWGQVDGTKTTSWLDASSEDVASPTTVTSHPTVNMSSSPRTRSLWENQGDSERVPPPAAALMPTKSMARKFTALMDVYNDDSE